MRVMILDHGAGNLHSLSGALTALGADARIESDASRLSAADALDRLAMSVSAALARTRAAGPGKQLAEMPQATQRGVVGVSRVDRLRNRRQLFGAVGRRASAEFHLPPP